MRAEANVNVSCNGHWESTTRCRRIKAGQRFPLQYEMFQEVAPAPDQRLRPVLDVGAPSAGGFLAGMDVLVLKVVKRNPRALQKDEDAGV